MILAASHAPKVFPMMMTPAGTIAPARVFVIGAGVAGLQAIATARRLGARVEAFDTRPVVAEQVSATCPRKVAQNASEMYSANVTHFIAEFYDVGNGWFDLNPADEIVAGCVLTRGGEVVDSTRR